MSGVTETRLQIYLPRRLHRHLTSAARRKGVSRSAYLRGLLEAQMRNGDAVPDDPLFELTRGRKGTGVRDASRRVDKYVYGGDA